MALMLSLLLSTTPERAGPRGVTVFFIALYVLGYLLIELYLEIRAYYKKQSVQYSAQRFTLIALLAGIPPMLLALQSLNQLQLRDAFIVAVLIAMVLFYWKKRG